MKYSLLSALLRGSPRPFVLLLHEAHPRSARTIFVLRRTVLPALQSSFLVLHPQPGLLRPRHGECVSEIRRSLDSLSEPSHNITTHTHMTKRHYLLDGVAGGEVLDSILSVGVTHGALVGGTEPLVITSLHTHEHPDIQTDKYRQTIR